MNGFRVARMVPTLVATAIALSLAACAPTKEVIDPHATSASLSMGYLDNVTHAPALVGLSQGIFAENLGQTELTTHTFSAGASALEALSSGAIDVAYLGPSPSINSYVRSKGASLVIVSGASVGGAGLVVSGDVKSAKDLAGKTLGSPQLGTTQDVALRSWLTDQGYSVPLEHQGDVIISPAENPVNFELFKSGKIDGAWVPEPWLSKYVVEAGGHVLVDEASLWPNGEFPTTVLVINKEFFRKYPGTVAQLVQANVDSIDWINDHPARVGAVINEVLEADTGKKLKDEVLTSALDRVTFTWDPEAQTFYTLLENAVALNLAKNGSLVGILQVQDLNEILTKAGLPLVKTAGLE